MKIALQVHPERATPELLESSVYPVLKRLGIAYQQIPRDHNNDVELEEGIDLLVTLGGDGTFLVGANLAYQHNLPILGVMVGRLGFLCSVMIDELETSLQQFVDGNMQIEKRAVIHGQVVGPTGQRLSQIAINDIVVHRFKTGGVRDFAAYFNHSLIARYRADGIILSSPLGSTAYNMAAGGPLVYPQLDLLLLTPICAHSMFSKPLVLPPYEQVRITVDPESYPLVVSFDGERRFSLESGEELVAFTEVDGLKFCRPASYDFFEVLRDRFQHGYLYSQRESGRNGERGEGKDA